ncbi:type II toxin-antitoxin system VapC family toxin [Halomarina pelagica]|uniref:type II toxin-antitoxin system VapC family toxin n=1 Tax=Halomarina pelagica TaxID=2961599 RepID=UPI0020C47E06|nr:PIN domain-containing protein [Halomarina sp. BND7]
MFDAEPIVAHADGEPGSGTVEAFLSAVEDGESTGFVNYVNMTEVRYILARKYDRRTADEYLDWLVSFGIVPVGIEEIWETAAEFVLDVNPALGDSFALATATAKDATLLAGGDGDYDGVTDVPIECFRDGPA